MEITIKDQVYKLKYTLRALFIFEQITGKMFKISTIMDEYIFFYSLLMANNKESTLTFDELIDELDKDPNLTTQYREFMSEEMKKQGQLLNKEEKTDSKKKL